MTDKRRVADVDQDLQDLARRISRLEAAATPGGIAASLSADLWPPSDWFRLQVRPWEPGRYFQLCVGPIRLDVFDS